MICGEKAQAGEPHRGPLVLCRISSFKDYVGLQRQLRRPSEGSRAERAQAAAVSNRLVFPAVGLSNADTLGVRADRKCISRLCGVVDAIGIVAVWVARPGVGVVDVSRRNDEQPWMRAARIAVLGERVDRSRRGRRTAPVTVVTCGDRHCEDSESIRSSNFGPCNRLHREIPMVARIGSTAPVLFAEA